MNNPIQTEPLGARVIRLSDLVQCVKTNGIGIILRGLAKPLISKGLNSVSDMEDTQRKLPLKYTQKELSRDYSQLVNNSFRESLEDLLDFFMQDSNVVLEYGPGANAVLLKYCPNTFKDKTWYAVDINQHVIDELAKKNLPNYKPLHGSSTSRVKQIKENSIDTVIGLCSFDSMINFKRIGDLASFYLKKGGRLIMIQDLAPSHRTIYHLLKKDPNLGKKDPFVVLFSEHTEHLAFIGHPESYTGTKFGVEDSRMYLQRRVAEDSCLNLIYHYLVISEVKGYQCLHNRIGELITEEFIRPGGFSYAFTVLEN
ncbi:MAG: hypothetical protein MAG795_00136 [Candidatus Woesearchaeota archaeon]|nr:hypothetical protein [Candidatus Woesearchaeota archaeon]